MTQMMKVNSMLMNERKRKMRRKQPKGPKRRLKQRKEKKKRQPAPSSRKINVGLEKKAKVAVSSTLNTATNLQLKEKRDVLKDPSVTISIPSFVTTQSIKKECITEECSFLHLPGTQRTNQNFVCTYCEESFKTKFELEKHNSLKHKDRRQSYASVVANNEKQFPFQETNMTQQPPGIFQFMEKQAQMMAQMMEVIKGLQPKQNQNQFLPQMSGQFPVQQHH